MRAGLRCVGLAVAVLVAAIVSPGGESESLAGETGIRLPAYRQTTLDNGLAVYVMPFPGLPLVDFRLVIKAGSGADPASREGLASLTADLLNKGIKDLSAVEIAEAVEFVGGRLTVSAGLEQTVIEAEFLSDDFEIGLDLLAGIVLDPVFAREEIERARDGVLGVIQSDKDIPPVIASQSFRRALFGGHPYSHPSHGTTAGVKAITRDDVTAFHSQHYRPGNALLVVVGDIDGAVVERAVARRFGGWKRGAGKTPAVPAAQPVKGRRVVIVNKPDVTQTQIRIGNLGIHRGHPDFFPVMVANTVLGAGFTSRLVNEIRVNRGLSYGASSRFTRYRETGVFLVSTFTKNATTRETIDVALGEIEKIRDTGITGEELRAAKNFIKGTYPLRLETGEDLARTLADLDFYDMPRDYVETYRDRVDAVTLEDTRRVLHRHFAFEDLLIVVVTNPEETRSQLESLGPIETWELE